MKALIPDLDDRTILKQVYLCINGSVTGDCFGKGEYFIADFAFVRKKLDDLGEETNEWEVIIADSKLGKTTNLTSNQSKAKDLPSYTLRSNVKDIFGSQAPIPIGTNLGRQLNSSGKPKTPFYKIFSDGYSDGTQTYEVRDVLPIK